MLIVCALKLKLHTHLLAHVLPLWEKKWKFEIPSSSKGQKGYARMGVQQREANQDEQSDPLFLCRNGKWVMFIGQKGPDKTNPWGLSREAGQP